MEEPKYIENFSTKELEEELQRRNQKPEPRDVIDWTPVHVYMLDVVGGVDAGLGVPQDLENGLLETVIDVMYECPYEFWAWWRNKA